MLIWLSIPLGLSLLVLLIACIRHWRMRDAGWRPRRFGLRGTEHPCSFCGMTVHAEAVICRHCHQPLHDDKPIAVPSQNREYAVAANLSSVSAKADPIQTPAGKADMFDDAFARMATAPRHEVLVDSISPRPDWIRRLAQMISDIGGRMSRYARIFVLLMLYASASFSATLSRMSLSNYLQRIQWRSFMRYSTISLLMVVGAILVWRSGARPDEAETSLSMSVVTAASEPQLRRETIFEPLRDAAEKSEANSVQGAQPVSVSQRQIAAARETIGTGRSPTRADNRVVMPARAPQSQRIAVTGATVSAVQKMIRARGYDTGVIDGSMGPRTRQAIRAYQRDAGLPPTGEIDAALLRRLNLIGGDIRSAKR